MNLHQHRDSFASFCFIAICVVASAALGCGGGGGSDGDSGGSAGSGSGTPAPDTDGGFAPASANGTTVSTLSADGTDTTFFIDAAGNGFSFNTTVPGLGSDSGSGTFFYQRTGDNTANFSYSVSNGGFSLGSSGNVTLNFNSPTGGTYSGSFIDGAGNAEPDSGNFTLFD